MNRREATRSRRSARSHTVFVEDVGDWWIGWIEEVPGANAQERTRTELLDSLRECLDEALELDQE